MYHILRVSLQSMQAIRGPFKKFSTSLHDLEQQVKLATLKLPRDGISKKITLLSECGFFFVSAWHVV